MPKNNRSVSGDQARREAASAHGFLVWIAVYLVLTLTFLIFDHPGAYHAVAGHSADSVFSAPHTVRALTPVPLTPIARGT